MNTQDPKFINQQIENLKFLIETLENDCVLILKGSQPPAMPPLAVATDYYRLSALFTGEDGITLQVAFALFPTSDLECILSDRLAKVTKELQAIQTQLRLVSSIRTTRKQLIANLTNDLDQLCKEPVP